MASGNEGRDESTPLLPSSNYGSVLPIKSGTEEYAYSDGDVASVPSSRGSLVSSIRELSRRINSAVAYHTGTIGMLGSVSIAVNTLTGPAMLGIPALFARSGIIPTCSTVLCVSFLCAFCSLHISNTISKVPGNLTFKKEVEYSEAFRFFWGNAWYNFTQGVFFCCISCLNISSIVDTAQVVDTFLGHWWPWGGTAALELSGGNLSVIRWDYSVCSDLEMRDGSCSPFNKAAGLHFTAGNLVVTVLFLPLARMDLKENAAWQVVAFLILLLTSVQFVVTFIVSGLDFSQVSLWGEDYDDLFGVVLFNFALVVAIPAWLYEREPDVDVPTVIHGSCALSSILYILIGILGHVAIPNVSDNMLQSMMSGSLGTCLQLGASIFAFAIVGLGIPLFSVLTRLNLVGSGLCSERVGNLFAVYFPFAVSWFLYDGDTVTKLLSWGGMIFTSLVAFVFPVVLTLHVVKEFDQEGSVDVYFGLFKSRRAELFSLRILLFATTIAIVTAIVGNIL